MNALADFAGRYGPFIWPAYGFTGLTFALMIADTALRGRHWRREVKRLAALPDKETADKSAGGATVRALDPGV